MRMFHHERDYLAATCEHLSIYVDFYKRHSTPLSTEARAKLEEIYQAHRKLPKPEEAGRVMGIRRSKFGAFSSPIPQHFSAGSHP